MRDLRLGRVMIGASDVAHPTTHGPQTWPWWRLLSWSTSRPWLPEGSRDYRLWLYTRWGSVMLDLIVD